MKKKLLSSIIIFMMILAMLPTTAFAEETDVSIVTSANEVKVGEKFNVTLTIPNVGEACYSASFKVNFDQAKVKVIEFNAPNITGGDKTQSTAAEANAMGAFSCTYQGQNGGENTINLTNGISISATFEVIGASTVGPTDFTVDSSNTFAKSVAKDGYTETDYITVPQECKTSVVIIGELTGTQAITGVTAPAKNVAPTTSITAPANTTAKVEWYEGTGTSKKFEGDKFAGETVYTAKITVTPDESYVYGDDVTFTLDGETITAEIVDGNAVITKTFPATAEKSLTGISVSPANVDTQYRHGDEFDKTTIEVTGTYDDGTIAVLEAEGYTVSGLVKGATSVTITAGDQTAELTLSNAVIGKDADGIITYEAQKVTYDGTDQKTVAETAVKCEGTEATRGDLTVTYKIGDEVKDEVKDAGTYDVYASLTGGTEYEALAEKKIGTFTVNPAVPTVDDLIYIAPTNLTYDRTFKIATVVPKDDLSGFGTITVYYEGTEKDGTAYERIDFAPRNVGNYKVTVDVTEGANYTAASNIEVGQFTIEPKKIDPVVYVEDDEIFDGSEKKPPVFVNDGPLDASAGRQNLLNEDEYTVEYENNVNVGTVTVKAYPAENGNYTWTAPATCTFEIEKAMAPTLSDVNAKYKYTDTTERQVANVKAMLPSNCGSCTVTPTVTADANSIIESVSAEDGVVSVKLKGGEIDQTATLTCDIEMANYENATLDIIIALTDRDAQEPLVISSAKSMKYGEKLTLTTAGGSGDGEVSYIVVEGSDVAEVDGDTLTAKKAGTVKVQATKAGDDNYNEITSDVVEITVEKATPTGTVNFPAVSASGKKLSEITPDVSKLVPAGGTFAWKLDGDTEIKANQSYEWTYTPKDEDLDNYQVLSGSAVLWKQSIGGGFIPAAQPVKVTTQSGENGKIALNPASPTVGSKVVITITPDEGYVVEDVLVDGKSVGAVTTYTVDKASANLSVSATFKKAEDPSEALIAQIKDTQLVARTKMAKAKGKKAVKVYWYAEDDTDLTFDGYEVFRSMKRYSGFGKKPYFSTENEAYYNTKDLKNGTKYYYKVRAYKVVDGKKVYTDWSTKAWRTVK